MKKIVSLCILCLMMASVGPIHFASTDNWEMKEVELIDYDTEYNIPSWAKAEIMYIHQLDKLHNKSLRIMPDDYSKPINRWEFTTLVMNAVYTLGQNKAHRETGLWIYDANGYAYRKGFEDPEKLYLDILQLMDDNLEYGDDRVFAISDARSFGIVNGKSADRFHPYDYITRQEAAKIMMMALDHSVKYGEYRGDGVLRYNYHPATYKDYEDVSEWAKPYVDMMSMLEIFQGDEEGNFNPKNNISYAEAHKIIYLYVSESIKFDRLDQFFIPNVSGRTIFLKSYLSNYPISK